MDPNKTKILVGPPGTGKTSRLLSIMEQEIVSGVNPRRIGYMAFTKKAADVAKQRALDPEKKLGLNDDDLPYFRTIHSLAFRQLGLKRDQVMQWSHYRELGDKLGMELRNRKNVEDGTTYGMTKEERLMFLEGLARIKNEPLDKIWRDSDEHEIDWWELERYQRALKEYKRSRMVLDYNDMITEFVEQRAAPALDVLIVDEAQDLSIIQWLAMEQVAKRAQRVYLAGDDDQAIYKWAGADVQVFIDMPGEVTVLSESHRIPRAVHPLAESIAGRISKRRAKQYKAREVDGAVKWYASPDEIDMGEGKWLLLARNGYMLSELEDMCIRNGFSFESVSKSPLQSDSLKAIKAWESMRRGHAVPIEDALLVVKYMTVGRGISKNTRELLKKADSQSFVTLDQMQSEFGVNARGIWHEELDKVPDHEREFFIAARKRGETLTKKPRITISTIHAAKGGEEDNVVLLTDMSYRTFTEMQKNPDDEQRVFYVGVTRTSQTLHLVQPRTNLCFDI